MKRNILLYLIFSLSSSLIQGQSTDHLKLYVLYDISHSTQTNNSREMLYSLASQLLEVNEFKQPDTAKIAASVVFIPFGHYHDPNSINSYKIFMNRKASDYGVKESVEIVDSLYSLTYKNKKTHLYTHLLEALQIIEDNSNESYGIIIITDGQLEVGDINYDHGKPWDRIKEYRKKIITLINKLATEGHPSFIVQSSEIPRNKYNPTDSLVMKQFVRDIEKQIVSDENFFWVKNNVNTNDTILKKKFEDFISNAIYGIVKSADKDELLNTAIKKLVLFSRIANFKENYIYLSAISDKERSDLRLSSDFLKSNTKVSLYDLFLEYSKTELGNIYIKEVPGVDEKSKLYYKVDNVSRKNLNGDTENGKEQSKRKKRKKQSIKTKNGEELSDIDSQDIDLKANKYYASDPLINIAQPQAPLGSKSITKVLDEVMHILTNTNDTLSANSLEILQMNLDTLMKPNYVEYIYENFKGFIAEIDEDIVDERTFEPFLNIANQIQYDYQNIQEQVTGREWQKAVVLGLSDYLINRTEQEAIFIFYEEVYEKVLKPNTFIADTLFYNFSRLLKPLEDKEDVIFEANLDLVKEALNEDIDNIPHSITMHPKIRESEGLVTLYYTTGLLNALREGKSIKQAFGEIVNELPNMEEGTVPVERAIMFISQLIAHSDKTNLIALYTRFDNTQLEALSKLIISYLSQEYPELLELEDLDEITNRIRSLFERYQIVERNIDNLKNQLSKLEPLGDFDEYRSYRRSITLSMLKEATSLLEESAHFTSFFPENSNNHHVSNQTVNNLARTVNNAIEAWFLIENQRYAEAVAMIIPMLPALPIERISELPKEKLDRIENIRTDLLVTELKEDKEKLSNVLKSELIDLTNNTYYFTDRAQADKFLVKHDLKFLSPLILSKHASSNYKISMPLSLTDDNLRSFYEALYEKYADKHTLIKKMSDGLELTYTGNSSVDDDLNSLALQYFSTASLDEKLSRLLALAGEASTANTAGDVKKVFQKYALPVASYRLKRFGSNHLMINAYVGGGIAKYQNENGEFPRTTWVVNALVGPEFSFANDYVFAKSLSFFFPLIDVGNIINYQVKGFDDERDVQIEKIISPGGFVVFGISKRFPLSIGAGYQWNPNRLVSFIAFDLPLFKIF